ncbi:MAG: hypothetical protein EOO70_02075 [Myxococcaceae bacterium]|nr:MAG: hypothetical protein EOO70_02075 [Myxococcaceae bacterium]
MKAQWGQKVENGETCATDLDCYSGACADGVCCDSACEGRCEACNMVGSEGVCSVVSQGTFCDDGDACTLADVCDGTGPDSCGGAPKACDSPPDQCHVAVGTCAQGACSYAPKPVGTMCDDGNACTRGETCGADTACGSGTMKTCDTPPGVCLENAGACLPATGECAYVPRQQGAACRAATGPCDVVEVCTGANGECPPDAKQPAGSACTDDGNPCTTDVCDASGTCLHPTMEAGTSCGAEGVCTGAAQCAQGCWIDGELHASGTTNPAGACQVCDPTQSKTAWSFKPATTQCRGASGVCDAAEYCTGSSAQCPGDGAVANGTTCGSSSEGSWGACGGFSGTCGESGTESRTVTAQACFNGACQPSSTTESRTCGRSTEGNTCGSSSSGNWSSCSYSGTCGEEGSRSRTVSGGVCSAGTCHQSSYTETEDCYRSTEGKACGTNSTEAWGSCSFYGGVCGETGARGRTVHRGICSSGSCNQSTYRETEGCSRSTTGIRCGDTNYYPWDICRNESNDCATTGTMTRSVTERLCEWGMCRDVSYYQSAGCTRNPAGRTCDDGNACTTGDVCTGGGGCSGTSMSCPAGQSCSGGVCSGGSGCSAGQQRCNGSCTDLLFDSYNCGGCGIQCNPNQNEVCSYGSCQCQQTPGSPYQCP